MFGLPYKSLSGYIGFTLGVAGSLVVLAKAPESVRAWIRIP